MEWNNIITLVLYSISIVCLIICFYHVWKIHQLQKFQKFLDNLKVTNKEAWASFNIEKTFDKAEKTLPWNNKFRDMLVF